MPYQASYICCNIIFDIWDSERILSGLTSNKYFITPSLFEKVEKWMIDNFILKVETKEQMDFLIKSKFIQKYIDLC